MQFIFSPIWGKLSDRHGRRPILLISTAGAAMSYVLFAIGSGFEDHTLALWALLVSRMFAGACGGNITVAQAYIADITPPENRSKRMGLVGMAFGLGFIFGPAISGVALKLAVSPRPAGRLPRFVRRTFSSPILFSPKAGNPMPRRSPGVRVSRNGVTRCRSQKSAC